MGPAGLGGTTTQNIDRNRLRRGGRRAVFIFSKQADLGRPQSAACEADGLQGQVDLIDVATEAEAFGDAEQFQRAALREGELELTLLRSQGNFDPFAVGINHLHTADELRFIECGGQRIRRL